MSEAQLKPVGPGVHAWIGAGGDSNAGAIETPLGLIVIDAQQNRALGEKFRSALLCLDSRCRSAPSSIRISISITSPATSPLRTCRSSRTKRRCRRSSIELGPDARRGATVTDTLAKVRMFFGGNFEELVPEKERQLVHRPRGRLDAVDDRAAVRSLCGPDRIHIAGRRRADRLLGAGALRRRRCHSS